MASKKKVLIVRDLGPAAMDILKARDDLELVLWPEDKTAPREWVLKNARGVQGMIIMSSDKIDQEMIDAAGPDLKALATCSVGFEHIDQSAVKKAGLRVGYTPDVLTDAVADIAIMLLLMASRNAGSTIKLVQDGEWPKYNWSPFAFTGPQLSPIPPLAGTETHIASPSLSTNDPSTEKTVGFLGFGRIAHAVLARLAGFGITRAVYASNPSTKVDPTQEIGLAAKHRMRSLRRVDLKELAEESDFLVILAPGGAGTHHVVDEAFLRRMKKTAVLVNAARGTLVDSDALAKALAEGWIYAAGLDVVEGEPNVGLGHPLLKEPRCVILPHIGSATTETRVGMTVLTARNLLAALDGQDMPAELTLKG